MKKLLLLFAAILLGSMSFAQPKDAGKKLDELATQLNLTDAQKQQLAPIFQEMRQKKQEMRSSGTKPTKEQMQETMKPYKKKIEAVLTPEQLAKWKEIKDENREQRQGKGSK